MGNTTTASSLDCDFLPADILEAYLLGRLAGQQQGAADDPEVQSVEEHLLWCEVCQAKAQSEEKEIAALRAALAAYALSLRKKAKTKVMAARLPAG